MVETTVKSGDRYYLYVTYFYFVEARNIFKYCLPLRVERKAESDFYWLKTKNPARAGPVALADITYLESNQIYNYTYSLYPDPWLWRTNKLFQAEEPCKLTHENFVKWPQSNQFEAISGWTKMPQTNQFQAS